MWFRKENNRLMRTYSNNGRTYGALQFGIDATGKRVVLGTEVDLVLDSLFSNGTASNYGKGSICMRTAGGMSVVDADGLWQAMTGTTVSQSVSPSHSGSPSASGSPSGSASASASPSGSTSPSVSPSGSASASASPSGSVSPSGSESPSVSPSASESPSASISPSASV